MLSFRTTLWAGGGNNVGIVVPEEVVDGIGRGKSRWSSRSTVDYRYRTTIASMGGRFLISYNAQTRAVTGCGAGDDVIEALRS